MVSSLLSNALHYAPPASTVECRFERSAAGWRLVVENRSELRPEDVASLSQPFWKKDRARADRDHSGLGLALARALAEKAGLTLTFEPADGVFRAILAGVGVAERAAERAQR